MSVSAVSSNNNSYQTNPYANLAQARADFVALAGAVKSGNVATSQQALGALKKDLPQLQNPNGPSSNPTFGALMTAVQSGDIAGAQKALASLQQSAKAGPHKHHQSGVAPTAAIGAEAA
jgi:hypothetical protein